MSNILNEITPLTEGDLFYIVDRRRKEFTFPIHRHKEFELNFIENGAGAERIVGDSVETIGDYELVLIGSENLEHTWAQGEHMKQEIREITIQFKSDIFSGPIYRSTAFRPICKMLEQSKRGLSFSMTTILKVYSILDKLVTKQGFDLYLEMMHLFHLLSQDEGCRMLSNSSFSHKPDDVNSRRIAKVFSYINVHYKESMRLDDVAALVGMTPPAFSRFFKRNTNLNLSDYITKVRLGMMCRMLVDTTMSVAEISYECGFNNISNLNRIFKTQKGMTPKSFRALYQKKRVIY